LKHQHALIDYDYAVKQLGGDKELLFKLLGKFKIQYDNSDAEIIEQINSGDFESASASSFIALVEGLEYDKAIAFLNT